MDELFEHLVAEVGVDRVTAEKAVAVILDFLITEAPAGTVQPLVEQLPGADALLKARGGTVVSGGVMGAGMRLMGLGLTMSQIQAVGREVIRFAREKAGADVLGGIADAVPGLRQFA